MTIPFQELSGSPEEQYTTDGFTAIRKFLVSWSQRDDFVSWLRGTSEQFGSPETVTYPNHADVSPWKIEVVPFDSASITQQSIILPSDALNDYNSYALVTVHYKIMTQQDLDDGPTAETRTRLTYRMNYQSELVNIPGTGLYWDKTSVSLGENYPIVKQIPLTEHVLTWRQVLYPPWDSIRNMQGKINSTEFLDCPTGTMLYLGASVNKLYRSDITDGASEFCWSIEYRFLQRIISQGNSQFGWNAAYRSETGLWENVVTGPQSNSNPAVCTPLYQSDDFNLLFVSQTP